MKSRISFFDKTIYKKAMTRFAPGWIIYTVCLLLGMMLMRQDNNAVYFHSGLANLICVMSVINLFYALFSALLLFGDLYNSRMCNMIHALPVTRESLFGSHVAAGLSWSLIPTLCGTVLALLLGINSELKDGWQVALWWLLGSNLQYLFFFGLATFSALCVGHRFAQAIVYFIINFASVIAYWLVDTLYTPLLYGVRTREDPFVKFSPTIQFASSEYIEVNWHKADGVFYDVRYQVTDGWGYLAICAGLGVLLLVAACLLYRKRNLECAGDFMALKVLEPVFLVVYSLIVATVFYFVCDEMIYAGGAALVYMSIGLTIGFFTGEMLLERTVKVLHKKAFLKYAVLAAAFALSLIGTALDPFGVTTWVPDVDEVSKVEVSTNYTGYYDYNLITLEDPRDIEDVIRTHEIALDELDHFIQYGTGYIAIEDTSVADAEYYNSQTISIHYHLKSGIMKSRYYVINLNGEAGDLMIPHFNTLDAIFRNYHGDTSLENILKVTQAVTVGCDRYEGTKYDTMEYDDYVSITDPEDIRSLMDAILADCALGVMGQNWDFRPNPGVSTTYWLDFDMGNQMDNLTIYSDCINTNTWLTEHGFISGVLEELGGVTVYYNTK